MAVVIHDEASPLIAAAPELFNALEWFSISCTIYESSLRKGYITQALLQRLDFMKSKRSLFLHQRTFLRHYQFPARFHIAKIEKAADRKRFSRVHLKSTKKPPRFFAVAAKFKAEGVFAMRKTLTMLALVRAVLAVSLEVKKFFE